MALIRNLIGFVLLLVLSKAKVHFLDYKFSDDVFRQIQIEVKCFGRLGVWQLKDVDSKILNHTEYIDQYARCWSPDYNDKKMCGQLNSTSPSINYFWDTSKTCFHEMKTFSVAKICEIMHGRGNIMIAGDSVSHEFFVSIANQIMREKGSQPTYCPKKVDIPCYYNGERWDLSIVSARNDRLSLVRESKPTDYVNRMLEDEWVFDLVKYNISLIVLNRGAHYENNTKLLMDLHTTIGYLRSNFKNISLIWRNTPYGHLDFETYHSQPPLTHPPDPSRLYKFNYSHFEEQNRIVESYLLAHHPETILMDVFTMTVLRSDSHLDPLHYCIPGPIDEWVTYFYNILMSVFKRRFKSLA